MVHIQTESVGMRVLLVDHGCCDPPTTRAHRYRAQLAHQGIETLICGPAEASPGLPAGGLHRINLQGMAAASPLLLHLLRDGTAQAFLQATGELPGHLLGLVRETARQTLAAAVDALEPDVIFVLHAGILADLAVETGAPVAVHVAHSDVARYRHAPPRSRGNWWRRHSPPQNWSSRPTPPRPRSCSSTGSTPRPRCPFGGSKMGPGNRSPPPAERPSSAAMADRPHDGGGGVGERLRSACDETFAVPQPACSASRMHA